MDPELYGFILAIIGAAVGGAMAYLSSYFLWKKQNEIARKSLIYAFRAEIENAKAIVDRLEVYRSGSESSSHIVKIWTEIPTVYPSGGLYYVSNNEIFKFPPEFSRKLYTFYINLTNAEEYRKRAVDAPNAPIRTLYLGAFHDAMVQVYSFIPELLEIIEKDYLKETYFRRFLKLIKKPLPIS